MVFAGAVRLPGRGSCYLTAAARRAGRQGVPAQAARAASQGSDRPAGLSEPPNKKHFTHINMNIDPLNWHTPGMLP